ncbi:MAG: GHMP kinase [Cytophagia bacterium]|nr:MAG: GHMP kinase [Runella sp.]TAG18930.1 MAG: GHMP kinase [Cytophagales bacterium]TAG39558.1 MAG: GHMP kinase [Cytophagia bacterium]TAG81174.1 MAG: GHMP kinase [Cytophagales bacterium]
MIINQMTAATFFQNPAAAVAASAPGRLDVMGGIADYSGSLVLQMPVAEQTTVCIAPRADNQLRVYSTQAAEIFQTSTAIFEQNVDFQTLGKKVRQLPNGDWAAYVLGCYVWLVLEKRIPAVGLDFFVDSAIPVGKGLSSSAALEVATLKALQKLFQLTFNGTELPTLAQQVENQFVGAPCGLMDQLASYFGVPQHLLPIVCQPDLVQNPVAIPEGVQFYGLDSGVRHAVGGASYGDVRTATFMGKTIINQTLPTLRYLCQLSVKEFENQYINLLPTQLSGADFLQQYGSVNDPISQVEAQKMYQIKACTQHAVYENRRVELFLAQLRQLDKTQLAHNPTYRRAQLTALGAHMYASHQSYSACGLGHPKTDELVEQVRQAAPNAELYGAKITGGGSGGTVCVLAWCQ